MVLLLHLLVQDAHLEQSKKTTVVGKNATCEHSSTDLHRVNERAFTSWESSVSSRTSVVISTVTAPLTCALSTLSLPTSVNIHHQIRITPALQYLSQFLNCLNSQVLWYVICRQFYIIYSCCCHWQRITQPCISKWISNGVIIIIIIITIGPQ